MHRAFVTSHRWPNRRISDISNKSVQGDRSENLWYLNAPFGRLQLGLQLFDAQNYQILWWRSKQNLVIPKFRLKEVYQHFSQVSNTVISRWFGKFNKLTTGKRNLHFIEIKGFGKFLESEGAGETYNIWKSHPSWRRVIPRLYSFLNKQTPILLPFKSWLYSIPRRRVG